MDIAIIDTIYDFLNNICNFLFSSYEGLAVLFITFIIITFIIAVILERRTKLIFKDQDVNNKESEADDKNNESPSN